MNALQALRPLALLAATLTLAVPAGAQDVTGAGATFPAPIYAKWADAYNKATTLCCIACCDVCSDGC